MICPSHGGSQMDLKFAFALAFTALFAFTAFQDSVGADIEILVLEKEGKGGQFFGAGHAAIHFERICNDNSPVKMRLCQPGERGSVFHRYLRLSSENYDWLVVPYDNYLYGTDRADQAPLFATKSMNNEILRYNYNRHLRSGIQPAKDGNPPEGLWHHSFAQVNLRSIYSFRIQTTLEEDLQLMEAINAVPNKSRFNMFWRNCADMPRALLKIIFPDMTRNFNGLGMMTPKGLAMEVVKRAQFHPEETFLISKFSQIPGTFGRSTENLFPLENAYKNKVYAIPTLLFAPNFMLAAAFYHTFVAPFSIPSEYKNYFNEAVARLTFEQEKLYNEQDELMGKMENARLSGRTGEFFKLHRRHSVVFDRLEEIHDLKAAERDFFFGTKSEWADYGRRFQELARVISNNLPESELKSLLKETRVMGRFSRMMFSYFEKHGRFEFDGAQNPVMSIHTHALQTADGKSLKTGISAATVRTGDPRLSLLVMMATIDHILGSDRTRHDTLPDFKQKWEILRSTAHAAGFELL
jgi:hypothetical protein